MKTYAEQFREENIRNICRARYNSITNNPDIGRGKALSMITDESKKIEIQDRIYWLRECKKIKSEMTPCSLIDAIFQLKGYKND